MKSVEELNKMSAEDVAKYCEENEVSVVIEDGKITQVVQEDAEIER